MFIYICVYTIHVVNIYIYYTFTRLQCPVYNMFEVRNFGPLSIKINGQELKKFVYLRVNNLNGLFEVIEVETDEILCVRFNDLNINFIIRILMFTYVHIVYQVDSCWSIG